MKISFTRPVKDERGQVVLLALILLLISGLMAAPLLAHMGTGLLTGQVYETKTAELYAADAGVEDAVWRIQSKAVNLTQCNDQVSYNITDVNSRTVGVTITYVSNATGILYRITSIATAAASNSSTEVESYLKFTPGTDLNIFDGALASSSTINLAKDSVVNGDVYHCGDLVTKPPFTLNGTDKGCAPFPSQTENEAFAKAFKDEALKGGTWPTTDITADTTLGPKYIDGDLTISRGLTVTLAGIVYVKGHIRCENILTITGTGSIVAEGYIYFKKLAAYTVTGDSIIMSLNSDITIKKSEPDHTLTINALIYAPNGLISFDKDMTVYGGVVGESIVVDMDGAFTYVPKTSWDFPGGLPGSFEIKTYNVSQWS